MHVINEIRKTQFSPYAAMGSSYPRTKYYPH